MNANNIEEDFIHFASAAAAAAFMAASLSSTIFFSISMSIMLGFPTKSGHLQSFLLVIAWKMHIIKFLNNKIQPMGKLSRFILRLSLVNYLSDKNKMVQ